MSVNTLESENTQPVAQTQNSELIYRLEDRPPLPQTLFAACQHLLAMFVAVITPALITGSIAERMRFPAFALFVLFWTTVVYDPFAHWVWGVGGWLRDLGVLDFAGGTVIHILSGVSGLVACLVMGKRRGYGVSPMMPHHLPMTVLGANASCILYLVYIYSVPVCNWLYFKNAKKHSR